MSSIATRRTPVPHRIGDTASVRRADYTVAVRVTGGPAATPEQWSRGVFEGAPAPLRLMLVLGWRLGLRLRLGPRDDRSTVLGWYLTHSDAETATLSAGSTLLEAQHHFLLEDGGLVWITVVRMHTRLGRLLWRLVAPVHQLSMPWLLRNAVRSIS